MRYSLQKDESLWILMIQSDKVKIVEWTESTFKLSAYHSFIAKVEKYYKSKLCEVFIAKRWKLMNINDSKWWSKNSWINWIYI